MARQQRMTCCTLTGVDERIDLAQVSALSKEHHLVEWGFLYSPKRQGQPGRYPSVDFLRNALKSLPSHVWVALHVCGAGVRQLIEKEAVVTELVQLVGLRGGRVQLNFNAHASDKHFTLEQLKACISRYPEIEFITQYNPANSDVWAQLIDLQNHSILFDASGGKGLEVADWPTPLAGVRCGYAGGLGPANVSMELQKIAAIAGTEPFWIDMEGKLRDSEDWFDLSAAKAVLEAVRAAPNLTSITVTSIDTPQGQEDNISSIPGAGMLEVGQWYWVLPSSEDDDGDELEDDADDADQLEPYDAVAVFDNASVSALPQPPVEGAWLGCLVKIGSNHVEIRQPDGRHGYSYDRVHFDEIHSKLVLEKHPEATLQGHITHYHQKSQLLLGQIQALTLRLGLSSSPMIATGPGAKEPIASQTNRALSVLNGQNNISAYQVALHKAKDEELPALFESLESANQELTRWMKAQSLPLLAQSEGIKDTLKDVDDRIFNVSIYAGLGETAVKVRDGKPAVVDERLRIMQRRLYMDEECLMNYRAGGMEFKDIAAYDKWLSKPENFNRILPFQRCMVAMRVRRNEKKRDWEGSLRQLLENIRVSASDQFTYMYIRNGEQLWRLDMEMEFDELIFPDKSMLNLSEPMMFKTFAGSRIDEMITVADFEQRLAKYNEAQEQIRRWCELNPGKDSFHCPIRDDWSFQPSSWHSFDHTSVYFDEAKGEIDQRIKYYNRIALIVQGLYDRSLVLHPHLPVRTWDAKGFEDAIELIYDSSYSLTFGEPPDFEAYRAGVNALATANSLFVGQENFWMRLEAKRECDRIDRDYRSRKSEYRPTLFKPRGNPGPGLVEKAEKLQIRAQKATFRWERERQRQSEWGDDTPVSCSVTVPFVELLNVSAYKKGDYKTFFRDPRTRMEYLKWAPLLLTAEDFLAGKLAD